MTIEGDTKSKGCQPWEFIRKCRNEVFKGWQPGLHTNQFRLKEHLSLASVSFGDIVFEYKKIKSNKKNIHEENFITCHFRHHFFECL